MVESTVLIWILEVLTEKINRTTLSLASEWLIETARSSRNFSRPRRDN
jgi:hypothetical protein